MLRRHWAENLSAALIIRGQKPEPHALNPGDQLHRAPLRAFLYLASPTHHKEEITMITAKITNTTGKTRSVEFSTMPLPQGMTKVFTRKGGMDMVKTALLDHYVATGYVVALVE